MNNAYAGHGRADGAPDTGIIGQALEGAALLYSAPPATVTALLVAGVVLGGLGDALLWAPETIGLNLSLWVASVAVGALVLSGRAHLAWDRTRLAWLLLGVGFAAGVTWRDAPALKLLALGGATLTLAIAAHRLSAEWVRRSGIVRYAGALALGALHAWTAAVLAVVDWTQSSPRVGRGRASGWRRAAAILRGLAIAAPLLAIFGALFMSADAVFADLVSKVVRVDFDRVVGHVVLFSVLAWISTGYLRSFLTGTGLPLATGRGTSSPVWPAVGTTEIATAMAAIDLLFFVFVVVQFRYLFGADALVQVTPDLTYAEYARRGFFELVVAVALVVPILLAADWLLDRRVGRNARLFGGLAGVQIALVLAIAASALERLRLYHASYGLTESRLYGMVLLIWIGAMLAWLAATVLRGRREAFAFGALVSGLGTVAVLFAINPDAVIARTNVARMASASAPVRFDVAYATSLSADAVPVLVDALPALPHDVQCPLAQRLLRRWSAAEHRSIRSWNWSVARASDAVREHEAQLRSMLGPNQACAAPGGK